MKSCGCEFLCIRTERQADNAAEWCDVADVAEDFAGIELSHQATIVGSPVMNVADNIAADDIVSSRHKLNAIGQIRMSAHLANQLSIGGGPDFFKPVVAAGDNALAIVADGQSAQPALVGLNRLLRLRRFLTDLPGDQASVVSP